MEDLELGRRLAAAIANGEVAFAFSPYADAGGYIAVGELTCRVPAIAPGKTMGEAFAQLARLPEAAEVHLHLLGVLLGKVREVNDRFYAVVSINLDADSLTEAGVEMILNARVQPFVLLEITERAKVDDARLELLRKLVDAGYKLALDDLGDRTHADADYVGWLLGSGLFSAVKLDFTRTNRLGNPETFVEVEGMLVPFEKSGLDLILEGSQAPREDGAWQAAVKRLRKLWAGKLLTPLPEVTDV